MSKRNDGLSAPAHVEFPLVGIGASAGGVPALQQFFEALPATTGAAYVVVLHLPPAHPSSLDADLAKITSMPVTQVATASALERNHVYIVAPSCTAKIDGRMLVVIPTPEALAVTVAIDVFLRSLAHCKRRFGPASTRI